jgi:hypothetical protein
MLDVEPLNQLDGLTPGDGKGDPKVPYLKLGHLAYENGAFDPKENARSGWRCSVKFLGMQNGAGLGRLRSE